MLKRTIKYKDFNDQPVEDVYYFNLTKSELVEMELEVDGGLGDTIRRIIETRDAKKLVAEFKRLILASYGQKSEDGKRFIKSDQLREEFSQTAAYNELFMELATDSDAATAFIRGILPSDMQLEVDKEMKTVANQPSLPPPPATQA